MSRNYAEYVQTNRPTLPTVSKDDDSFVEESDVLNELNGVLGR